MFAHVSLQNVNRISHLVKTHFLGDKFLSRMFYWVRIRGRRFHWVLMKKGAYEFIFDGLIVLKEAYDVEIAPTMSKMWKKI